MMGVAEWENKLLQNKFQITNPDYITSIEKIDYVKKNIAKYSLTEGLNEKSYRKIIESNCQSSRFR